jgi:hypothetical protein
MLKYTKNVLEFVQPIWIVHFLLKNYLLAINFIFESMFCWLPGNIQSSEGLMAPIANSKAPVKSIMTRIVTSQHVDGRGVAFAGNANRLK